MELIIKEHNTQVSGKSYFIVTDYSGITNIFDRKPFKSGKSGVWQLKDGQRQQINDIYSGHSRPFKNLTFDSDPMELVLVNKTEPSVKEHIKEPVKDCFDSIFNIKL